MFPLGVLQQQIVAAGSSLLTDLKSWWMMEETSSTRYDSHGSNNIVPATSTTYRAGKIGNAPDFVGNTSLTLTDSTPFEGGARSFSFCFWVYFDVLNTPQIMIGVGTTGSPSAWDYLLQFEDATQRFRWIVAVGSSWPILVASSFGAPSVDTPYFVYADYDHDTGTMGVSINNGTKDTRSSGGTPNTSGNPFWVGQFGSLGQYVRGYVDEVGFWDRILTSDEITTLYNSGSGVTYTDL